jgi:DNA-binding GntR family transcriptional regulator
VGMAEARQKGQSGAREIVTSTLARTILSGETAPGDRLATEAALQESMEVSRGTRGDPDARGRDRAPRHEAGPS